MASHHLPPFPVGTLCWKSCKNLHLSIVQLAPPKPYCCPVLSCRQIMSYVPGHTNHSQEYQDLFYFFWIERQKENMNMGNMILVSSRADKRKCAENIGVWRDRDIEVVVGVPCPVLIETQALAHYIHCCHFCIDLVHKHPIHFCNNFLPFFHIFCVLWLQPRFPIASKAWAAKLWTYHTDRGLSE